MALIAGKYQHYRNENIDEYFSAINVPYIGRKMIARSSPLMEVSLDGDTMTIKNTALFWSVGHTFKLGEEYEEKMPSVVFKSVTTIENDNVVETKSVVGEGEGGARCGRRYLFTEHECVVTLYHDQVKTTATRYFRRCQ